VDEGMIHAKIEEIVIVMVLDCVWDKSQNKAASKELNERLGVVDIVR
jgi:hypothetical protein